MTDAERIAAPCPFCGGVAETDQYRGYHDPDTGRIENECAIYCVWCGADMTRCHRDTPNVSPEEIMGILIKRWNRRTALDQSSRIAALEAELATANHQVNKADLQLASMTRERNEALSELNEMKAIVHITRHKLANSYLVKNERDDLLQERNKLLTDHTRVCSIYRTALNDNVEHLADKIRLEQEIDRLTRERDDARANTIKIRWEGEHLFIGSHKIGWCWVRQSDCLAYLCNGVSKFLGGFSDEPAARAAVEKAAIENLTKEHGK